MLCNLTYMWNLKGKAKKTGLQLKRTEVIAREEEGEGAKQFEGIKRCKPQVRK